MPNASAVQFASDSELQFAKQYHTHQCRFICNDQRNAGLCGLTHISLSEHKTHNISSIHVVHETREPPAAHTLPCSDTYNVFVPWGWVYFTGFLVCIAKHAAAQTVRFCRAIIFCILCATRLFEVTVHKQQEHTSIEHEQTRPAPFPESGCSTGSGVRLWLCQILSRVMGAFRPRCTKNVKSRPGPARRAGKSRVKQARRNWKFWGSLRGHTSLKHRRLRDQNGDRKFHVCHSLAFDWSRLTSILVKLGRILFHALLLGLLCPVIWHRPWGPKRKRRKTKKTACPTHYTLGLNQLLRGGGKGGSKSTARKRAENQEQELLQGLTQLLQNFSKPEAKPKQAPKPKASPKSNGPNNPRASFQTADSNKEKGLFQALERLVFRARQQPGTLIQRLTTLVQSASHGNNLNQIRQPRRRRKATEREQDSGKDIEPPRKKPRDEKTLGANPPAIPPDEPSPPPGRNNRAYTKPSWADIAANKARPNTSNSSRKPPQQARWSLLHSAWPEGALVSAQTVQTALEQGKTPTGAACFCQSLTFAQDLQRLTKLHQLSDVPFALILPQCDDNDGPLESKTMHFPTKEVGKPGLRPFCVLPLTKTLPNMPAQKLKSTSVSTEKTPLATFRISVAQEILPKVQWEGIKADPRGHILKVFDDRVVHSTYGWKEAEISSKRQEKPDVLLQGILRTKENFVETVLKKSGQDGLFVDRLTNQQQPRPNLWWIQRQEDEEPRAYYLRAVEEAQKEGATLAFRKGGGAFLGLRLKENRHKPQLHAWTLHGAPKHWSGQEVLKCLFEAGCTEVAIIRPPARQRSWLVKAIVPDENAIGVLGIQAGDNVLYLNRVQYKIKRSEEVLQVIRPQIRSKPGTKEVAPNRDAKSVRNNDKPQKEQPTHQQNEATDSRTRSRSPTGKGRPEANPAIADLHAKFDIFDCGGEGNCGYNCLAAALGLDKGESFDKIKDALTTRGRTVRNDLFKHMRKHNDEYSAWFLHDSRATEEQEAGPVPTTWSQYLEATLRDGRWIDGLSWQAAAKRYGLHIIVIPLTGNDKDRPMAFGSARSGREPVVLLLQAGHYQLAQRKAGKQWPKPWASAEPAKLDSAAFRGGGKSCASSSRRCASSSRHSWRPHSTPDSGKTPTEHPQKFAEIPQSAQSKHRDAVSRTHVVQTAGASPQQPDVSTVTCGKRKRTSIATKETRSKTQRGSRAGTLQETDLDRFQVQAAEDTTVNRVDNFQWTCNLCDQVFRGKLLKSIECMRRRHIAKVHPKQGHLVNLPVRRKPQIVEPSVYIPDDQRMWSCPKCSKGFHYMSKRVLKLSKEAHLTKCYGITLKKLRSLKYNSPHWKAHHKKLVQDNAQNKKDKSDERIQEYNKENDAGLFRIPAYRERSSDQFGCAKCSKIFQKMKEAMQHTQ